MEKIKTIFMMGGVLLLCAYSSPGSSGSSLSEPETSGPNISTTANITIISSDEAEIIDENSSESLIAIEIATISSGAIATGDVIALDQSDIFPNGGLKKVTSWATSQNKVMYSVEDAVLTEVIESGTLSVEMELSQEDLVDTQVQMKNISIQDSDEDTIRIVLDDYPVFEDESTQVDITGFIEITPSFEFEMSFNEFQLESFYYRNSSSQTLELFVESQQTIELNRKIQIGNPLRFKPISIRIGAIPIVVQPVLTFYLSIQGSLDSSLSVNVEHSSEFSAEFQYDNEEFSYDSDFSQTNVLGSYSIASENVDAKIALGPDLELKIYNLLGPSISLEAGVQYESINSQNPFLTIDTVVRGKGSIDFSAINDSLDTYDVEIFDVVENLLELTLEPPIDLEVITNGDSSVLLNWSESEYAEGYYLYWRKGGAPSVSNSNVIENISSGYVHSNLEAGTYYYSVASVRNGLVSDLSEAVSIAFDESNEGISVSGFRCSKWQRFS